MKIDILDLSIHISIYLSIIDFDEKYIEIMPKSIVRIICYEMSVVKLLVFK